MSGNWKPHIINLKPCTEKLNYILSNTIKLKPWIQNSSELLRTDLHLYFLNEVITLFKLVFVIIHQVSTAQFILCKMKLEDKKFPKEISFKMLNILMLRKFLQWTRSCKQMQKISALYWKYMHTKRNWFISREWTSFRGFNRDAVVWIYIFLTWVFCCLAGFSLTAQACISVICPF